MCWSTSREALFLRMVQFSICTCVCSCIGGWHCVSCASARAAAYFGAFLGLAPSRRDNRGIATSSEPMTSAARKARSRSSSSKSSTSTTPSISTVKQAESQALQPSILKTILRSAAQWHKLKIFETYGDKFSF